jgi:site-specific DNA recombinase
MVDDVLAGKGPTAISNWLDAESIPTSKDILRIRQGKEPAGIKWRYPAVLNILRSRAVCGITEIDGKIVYGDDGLPVRFAEPIIDDATWDRLQKALDRLSRPVNRRRADSPWLTGVTFCKSCGLPLHGKRQTNKGKLYEYMTCDARRERRQCNSRQIRQDRLEAEIDRVVSKAEWSCLPYMETRTIEGRNHAPEMATIKAAIKDIAGDAEVKEAMGESADEERTRVDILKSRLANLRNMPDEPDRIVYVQTGESITQHWDKLSGAGRNAMLLSHQAKVLADQQADTGLVVEINPGTLAYPPVSKQVR